MLKIKDDVDLKELEKFGFIKIYKYKGSLARGLHRTLKGFSFIFYDEDENRKTHIIYIDKKSRIIEVEDFEDEDDKEKLENARNEIINKLIQAGLVEEMADNE